MKILILSLLFFTMNVFAGYMSKIDMLDCEKSGRTFYLKLQTCQKNHADCKTLPQNFICETHSEQDTSVNDFTKPIKTKSEMVTCSDPADCQAKLAAKVCTDSEETAIKNLDLMEVYCSKDSFSKMIVKQIREDATKKATYDAANTAKTVLKLDIKNKRIAAKALSTKLNAGTDLTSAELRQVLLAILKELRD